MYSRKKQSGFTLIEIAIVLVIIGLLLGGVLKGQELITSARVRNLISIQDGYKAAFYGFQDRYRALPGDYSQASKVISGVASAADGNGNGFIDNNEYQYVWDHLSHSGFITGNYAYNTSGVSQYPTNPYSAPMELVYGDDYVEAGGNTSTTNRHILKTGAGIPSDILAEVDRKIDDGRADQGSFRYSSNANNGASGGTADPYNKCATTDNLWNTQAADSNCGAAVLF
ncbi:MAG TPA: prepilin-type N-terminal cleavage/methylation domain-containing protein [Burkholderiales bacterium]|nr:prepilin-type N-terminal cleavage/methylation domain-containing protein [Burkholderiales bacterium]